MPVRCPSSRRRLFAIAAAVLVCGCRAPESAELRLSTNVPLTAAAFPGAASFAPGFDGLVADREWRAGDEVLFGLRLSRRDERRHWLLHLRVTEPTAIARDGDDGAVGEPLAKVTWTMRINGEPQQFPSRLCRVLVTVCDGDGQVLGRSEPLLPLDLLARGLQPACQEVARLRAQRRRHAETDDDEATLRPLAEATVCTVALLQIVQDDRVLSPILWQVVQRPSLWSLVTNLGARVVLRPAFQDLRRERDAASPTWRVPMSLYVNDDEALRFELLASAPARPFALCGGIVGATARHPADADLEFALLLLGAHAGR